MAPLPAPREFIVIHVASAIEGRAKPKTETEPSQVIDRQSLVLLGGLLYLAGALGYAVLSNVTVSLTSSEPYVWGVCLPYAALMIKKLIRTIRAMEATEETSELVPSECVAPNESEAFGHHASHDVIAIVGDVCIYVIGLLLLCYFALPWLVCVESSQLLLGL